MTTSLSSSFLHTSMMNSRNYKMADRQKPDSLSHGAGSGGQFGARTGPVTEGARGASAPQARVVLPTGPTAPATISPKPTDQSKPNT